MALPEDCEEFLRFVGTGKYVFQTWPVDVPTDERLSELFSTTNVPVGMAVFVLTPSAAFAGDHLRSRISQGQDLFVNLVDPETMKPVEDLDELKAAQLSLGGVPITAPTVHRDDPQVVTVADAHRLLSAGQLANREHLRKLPTRQSLMRWLESAPDRDPDQPVIDHSLLLGVPHALYDRLPEGDLRTLRDSPVPLSLRLVQEALGGTLAHVGIDVLKRELTSGEASAALVHGWAPGSEEPRTFWLVRGPEGGLSWADPLALTRDKRARPAALDGGVDELAAIAERQGSMSLLLNAAGEPYTPAADPVRPEESGAVTKVGQWSDAGRTETRQLILDVAGAAGKAGVPVVVVDVRRGPSASGKSTLDPVLSVELGQALRAQPGRPLVVATERNAQLETMVRGQFEGVTVLPEIRGLGDIGNWLAQSGTGLEKRFDELTVDAVVDVAPAPAVNPLPKVLRDWLLSKTWADADEYFQKNAEALRAKEVVTALGALADRIAGQGEALAADGTKLKQSRLFQPDATLKAFEGILAVAGRTAEADTRSYKPEKRLLFDPIDRHTEKSDENLLLGFLASRRLADVDSEPLQPYTDALLWLRELIQALVDHKETGLGINEILAVMRARGGLAGEVALLTPKARTVFSTHAFLTEELVNIIFPEHGTEDPEARPAYDVTYLQKIREAVDCLPGMDRTAWNFIFQDSVLPKFKDKPEEERLNLLLQLIVTC